MCVIEDFAKHNVRPYNQKITQWNIYNDFEKRPETKLQTKPIKLNAQIYKLKKKKERKKKREWNASWVARNAKTFIWFVWHGDAKYTAMLCVHSALCNLATVCNFVAIIQIQIYCRRSSSNSSSNNAHGTRNNVYFSLKVQRFSAVQSFHYYYSICQ